MKSEFLSDVERQLDEAAADPLKWTSALEAIARATGSDGAALLTIEGRGPVVLPTESMTGLADDYIQNGWYKKDFRYNGVPILKNKGIFVDQDIVTLEQMGKMPYYQDFLIKHGFGWFAGIKIDTGDDVWCLTLQRAFKSGGYDRAEQEKLVRLGGVVSRAAKIARQLGYARLDGAAATLEHSTNPCFFLDRFGAVIRFNPPADRLIGQDLQLREGQLRSLSPNDQALQNLIQASVLQMPGDKVELNMPVVVTRQGKRPLIFHAMSLGGALLSAFSPARTLLVAIDLDAQIVPEAQLVQAAFALTGAEARLALALTSTFNLVDAAQQLGVSYETVRKLIRSVFEKTGTTNQAELVGLLNRVRR